MGLFGPFLVIFTLYYRGLAPIIGALPYTIGALGPYS